MANYEIHVSVIQSKPSEYYSIVEKTVWNYANGGTWTGVEEEGEQLLRMGGSGTSGTLRFKNPHGDYLLVALGVHADKRWCDIEVDLHRSDTGVHIHPSYYDDNSPRHQMLAKQLSSLEKTTAKGVRVLVDYYKEQGNTYWAAITIA